MLWILNFRYWILCHWNLDSVFQSLQGFQKKPTNLDPITQISRIPNFNSQRFPGFRIPKAKLPGFQIPQASISRIGPYIERSTRRNRIEFSPINVITVTKKRLIILITLHMLNNYWMIRFLRYSGTPLYGHPLYTDSFVCPDKKLIYFL